VLRGFGALSPDRLSCIDTQGLSLIVTLMSEIVTGEAYVEAITSRESDRRARAAFQDLVLRIARPGAALFDFGAGPGLDARLYAERGFTVTAYDIDPKMREFFSVYCREFIETGKILLYGGSYREFLDRNNPAERGADLVTSNFAPLNLVRDLRELFAKFYVLTRPNGYVLASVLSPYWVGDLKCLWWWRNALRLWRDGYYLVPGPLAPTVRRRLANYVSESAPYFALERVFPGTPTEETKDIGGVNVSRGSRHAWMQLTRCHFMFLLFRKQNIPA
jgi:SAM-dependent methyltransferase